MCVGNKTWVLCKITMCLYQPPLLNTIFYRNIRLMLILTIDKFQAWLWSHNIFYRRYCFSLGLQLINFWKDTIFTTIQHQGSGCSVILCALTVCCTRHLMGLLKTTVSMLLFCAVLHWNVLKSEALICHFHELFKALLLCTWRTMRI